MDVSDQIPGAFSAVVEPGAEPSPPEAVAPEVSAAPVADAPPVAPDPTPDIDALVQQKVDAFKAEQAAAEQRAKEQQAEEMRWRMRQQVEQSAQQLVADLNNEDQSLAQRVVQLKTFVERERDEAFVQRDNGLKALDAVMLVLERRHPDVFREVTTAAPTLMPYQTHEEMDNFLTQQTNQYAAKDAVISDLQAQIDALTQQIGGLGRDPNADRVESGGTGIPAAGNLTDPSKAKSWEEWLIAARTQ